MKSIMFSGGNNPSQKITGTSLTLDNINKGVNLSVNQLPQLNPFADKITPQQTKIPFLGNNSTPNTLSFSSNPSITYQPPINKSVFNNLESIGNNGLPSINPVFDYFSKNTNKFLDLVDVIGKNVLPPSTIAFKVFKEGCENNMNSPDGRVAAAMGGALGALRGVGMLLTTFPITAPEGAVILASAHIGGMISMATVCAIGGINGLTTLIIGQPKQQQEIKASTITTPQQQQEYFTKIKQSVTEAPEYKEISTILESLKNPPLNGGMMYKKVIYSSSCPDSVKRVEELGAKLIANFANKSITLQPLLTHQQLLEQGYKIMTFTPLDTGILEVINMQLGGTYTDINGRTYHRSIDPNNGQFYTKP